MTLMSRTYANKQAVLTSQFRGLYLPRVIPYGKPLTPIAVPSHKRPLTTPTTHTADQQCCNATSPEGWWRRRGRCATSSGQWRRMPSSLSRFLRQVPPPFRHVRLTPDAGATTQARRQHEHGDTTTRRANDTAAQPATRTHHHQPPPTTTSHQRPHHHHTTTTPPPPTNPGDCPRRRTPASKNERPRTKTDAHARGRPPANQDDRPRTKTAAHERRLAHMDG